MSEWEKVKIGELLTRNKKTIILNDSNIYKRVTVKLWNKGVKRRDEISALNIATKKQYVVKTGQFILSKIDARNGAFGIIPNYLDNAVTSADFLSYDVDKKNLNIEWFNLYTSTPEFNEICIKSSMGTTNRKRLNEEKFLNYEIELPAIEIQNGLINIYKSRKNSIDGFNNEIETQETLLIKLRQSILQEAVQGKLVEQDPNDEPASVLLEKIKTEKDRLIREKKIKKDKSLPPIKDEEKPYDLPQGWQWCRLSDICLAIIDCPHSTPHYIEKETGFYAIDSNCINKKSEIIKLRNLSEEDYIFRKKRLEPQEGDIAFIREGSIGLSAFIPAHKKICLGQRTMLYRCSLFIFNKFLKYVITEPNYLKKLMEKNKGIGAKHVNVSDIKLSGIPLPPLEEQKRIVEKVDKLMQFCDELEEQIKQSKTYSEQLMQSVLQKAFNGDQN